MFKILSFVTSGATLATAFASTKTATTDLRRVDAFLGATSHPHPAHGEWEEAHDGAIHGSDDHASHDGHPISGVGLMLGATCESMTPCCLAPGLKPETSKRDEKGLCSCKGITCQLATDIKKLESEEMTDIEKLEKPSPEELDGTNPCSDGPAYWCNNRAATAKKCKNYDFSVCTEDIKKPSASCPAGQSRCDKAAQTAGSNCVVGQCVGDTAPPSTPATPATSANGCCYSIGYGDVMVPCCLITDVTETKTKCDSKKMGFGGASGWAATCPSSAAEAHSMLSPTKPSSV